MGHSGLLEAGYPKLTPTQPIKSHRDMMNIIFEYGLLLFSMIDGKISPVNTIEADPAQDNKPKLMNSVSMVRIQMMITHRMDGSIFVRHYAP